MSPQTADAIMAINSYASEIFLFQLSGLFLWLFFSKAFLLVLAFIAFAAGIMFGLTSRRHKRYVPNSGRVQTGGKILGIALCLAGCLFVYGAQKADPQFLETRQAQFDDRFNIAKNCSSIEAAIAIGEVRALPSDEEFRTLNVCDRGKILMAINAPTSSYTLAPSR